MRKSCVDCAIKHLSQAEILLEEAALGYPQHKYLAMGHLAEAESELLDECPEFARNIRTARLSIVAGEKLDYDGILAMLIDPNSYKSILVHEESHVDDSTNNIND